MRANLFLLSLLAPLCWAIDITGRVTLDSFPNHLLPIGSKVSLDHGKASAFIRGDGSFTIYNVPDGEHLLEPIIPGYNLPTTLYTISQDQLHAQPYYPHKLALPTTVPSLPLPLALTASLEDYYTPAQSMNILGMLKSPMVLMMLFSAVMMFALPKLIESMDMDPEMAKDMAETRKKMQGMQNMDFMGSLSSMLAGETPDAEKTTPQSVAASSTGNNGKKRNKGR